MGAAPSIVTPPPPPPGGAGALRCPRLDAPEEPQGRATAGTQEPPRAGRPPPALIIFHRETSNYAGIQARSANRVEKLDDLKIFNYQEKRGGNYTCK